MNRSFLLWCLAVSVALGCGEKKRATLTGDELIDVGEFIGFFHEVPLPLKIADTTLARKQSDSSLIPYKIFTRFIPDSVLKKEFGKTIPKLYQLGRAQEKGKETYLFVKAMQGAKRAAFLVCFDKNDRYLNALPLVVTAGKEKYASSYGSLDSKFQITTFREKRDKPGDRSFKRNVYIYNSAANEFTLILTEPNEDIIEDIINPLDTLPQKNKYTGDYQVSKKNFISFRDGKKTSEVLFFVHFEKDKGECIGELKGVARFVSPRKALYRESGNPCTLEFSFSSSSVTMKEIEGCGSFRGIKCFFEGTFPKKKKSTSKKAK